MKRLKKALLEDNRGARFYSFWIVKRPAVMAGTAIMAGRCRTDPVRMPQSSILCLREQAHHEGTPEATRPAAPTANRAEGRAGRTGKPLTNWKGHGPPGPTQQRRHWLALNRTTERQLCKTPILRGWLANFAKSLFCESGRHRGRAPGPRSAEPGRAPPTGPECTPAGPGACWREPYALAPGHACRIRKPG